MAFYNPDGSGNVHTPQMISGGKGGPVKNNPAKVVKVAAKKASPVKKAAKKTAFKKAK